MSAALTTVIAVLMSAQLVSAQNFTRLVNVCVEKHADRLNECFVDTIKRLQPSLVKGIPSMKIPSMEPLLLHEINFTQHEGPVTVNSHFTQVAVYSASKFDLKYLDVNFEKRTINLGLTYLAMYARGKYKIGGRIFDLPIVGEGDFRIILQDLTMQGMGYVRPVNGVMQVYNMNVDFTLRDVKFKFGNLFPDNKLLSDTVHHFLDNNHELLVAEVRPELSRQLGGFYQEIINQILSVINYGPSTLPSNSNSNDRHRKRTLAALARLAAPVRT